MRERSLLHWFLALNVALAGAFIAYLVLSNSSQREIVSATFPAPARPNLATNALVTVIAKPAAPQAGLPVAMPPEVNPGAPAGTNQAQIQPVLTTRKFNWEQVGSEEYSKYLDSLRAVGCPEGKVRYIILTDINELFAKKRLREAVARDTPWWREEPELMLTGVLEARTHDLEEQRHGLVTKLLGAEALEQERGESIPRPVVQLTGSVLGSLPPEVHNKVQDICARSLERSKSALGEVDNQGQRFDWVESARMRDQTRTDLKQVLNDEQMEEFLLRYSQNATGLRTELRGLEPTPDEFRKAFRAIDPIDHQMQLQFGTKDAMSEKQRERYERRREEIIKEAVGSQRFEAYRLTKDPLYLQAQLVARQYGAPQAVMPIYQMTRANETRRQQIMSDPALTPQQRAEALNSLFQEQQRSVRKMAGEAKPQGRE